MSRLGERWKVLSPHLDRALEMTPQERGPWLEALAAGDPTLAADLQNLLDEHHPARRRARDPDEDRQHHRDQPLAPRPPLRLRRRAA
jgi:hypothetical protein